MPAVAMNAATMPMVPMTPPRSNRRNWPRSGTTNKRSLQERQRAGRDQETELGWPKPANDMLKMPREWVARNDSAETRKNPATTSAATRGDMNPRPPVRRTGRPCRPDRSHGRRKSRSAAAADSDASDGSIEAVSKPVERQEHDHHRQSDAGIPRRYANARPAPAIESSPRADR